MPESANMTRAILQEIRWNSDGTVRETNRQLKVQFNPETLKLTFSNQIASGDSAGGSAIQFSGKGTTKLSFELWFDVTDPNIDASFKEFTDVRHITKQVADFMKTESVGTGNNTRYVPPGVRFLWGTFLFEGVMESINETLEFFSEKGKPLRASVSVSLTKQEVDVQPLPAGEDARSDSPPGTQPVDTASQGETYQQRAARRGNVKDWQEGARADGVENPRHIAAGTPLSLAANQNPGRL
jgi:hypothetical protein